jgi:Sec-independent protein translocase protein TatA
MIFRILLYAFLAYVLYKIIFELVIPVYKATRQFKKGFREMHNRMGDYMKDQQEQSSSENNTKPSPQKSADDYIDFEEIK